MRTVPFVYRVLLIVVSNILVSKMDTTSVFIRPPNGILSNDDDSNVGQSVAEAVNPAHRHIACCTEESVGKNVRVLDDVDEAVYEQREVEKQGPDDEGLSVD